MFVLLSPFSVLRTSYEVSTYLSTSFSLRHFPHVPAYVVSPRPASIDCPTPLVSLPTKVILLGVPLSRYSSGAVLERTKEGKSLIWVPQKFKTLVGFRLEASGFRLLQISPPR